MIQFLNEAEIAEHLHMADLIPTMAAALQTFSAGEATQPVRGSLAIEDANGFLYWMPAQTDTLGVKLVTLYPENDKLGMPTHNALIILFDKATGVPSAVMDGRLITEMRTAAVSAVATDLLALPDAKVMALLGSGVQAASHLEALKLVRDFTEIRVWSRTPAHATAFADRHGIQAVSSAEEAVRGADVVNTLTAATLPILQGVWLEPGAHVNAVGAPRPDWRELDDDAMANLIYVDSRAGASRESGDIVLSGATIHAELGEALATPSLVHRDQITVFKSLGMAVEDMAAAQLVQHSARK